MDRKNLDRFYAENTGLIHQVARKAYPRFQAIGSGMEYDELVQEASVMFIKAYEAFDENAGFTFSTYFFSVVMRHFNKMAESVELERLGVHSSSKLGKEGKWEKTRKQIHAGCSSVEEMSRNMEAGASVLDVIPSGAATPEEELAFKQTLSRFVGRLSPLAAFLAQCVIDPPDFLERELGAYQAHSDHAREIGVRRRSQGCEVTLRFVALVVERVTGLEKDVVREARAEIERTLKWAIS